jgi:hypothetical protein
MMSSLSETQNMAVSATSTDHRQRRPRGCPSGPNCGRERSGGTRSGRLAPLLIVVVAVLSLSERGQARASNSSATDRDSAFLLPAKVVVSLEVVKRFFPDLTRQASTGRDDTAVGNPKATRKVIYENDDGSKKVTITVDHYRSWRDASTAYGEALQKSEAVPGFKLIRIPQVGQRSFAGTVTMGGETHTGMGVLDGKLIMGLTLAGYDATSKNISNLVVLARVEDAVARAALN